MGLNIVRLKPGKVDDMKSIKVAAETYYVSPDGAKAFKRGDSNMPAGSRLLARKGSPIDEEVAKHYNLETEDAQDVARVPTLLTTPAQDRGLGVSSLAEAGFTRIEETARITEESAAHVATANQAGISQGRQADMLRQARVEEAVAEATGVRADSRAEPGTNEAAMVGQTSGLLGNAGNEAVTRQLEQGERDATARHIQEVHSREAAQRAESRDNRPETVEDAAQAKATDEGKAATSTRTAAAGANSRTRKVGGASKRTAGKREAAKKTDK